MGRVPPGPRPAALRAPAYGRRRVTRAGYGAARLRAAARLGPPPATARRRARSRRYGWFPLPPLAWPDGPGRPSCRDDRRRCSGSSPPG